MTKPRAGTIYGVQSIHKCPDCQRHQLFVWSDPPRGVCVHCNPDLHPWANISTVTTLPKSAFRVRAEANGQ